MNATIPSGVTGRSLENEYQNEHRTGHRLKNHKQQDGNPVFGGGIGFVYAAGNNIALDGHDHAAHGAQPARHAMVKAGEKMTGHHGHGELLEAAGAAPSVSVNVSPDPESGWNLHVTTRNFRFAPQNASAAHVPGEGHAHVYVNGTKIARLYGEWLHIAELPKGSNRIEVTLNANDHRGLAVAGKPVSGSAMVEVE